MRTEDQKEVKKEEAETPATPTKTDEKARWCAYLGESFERENPEVSVLRH